MIFIVAANLNKERELVLPVQVVISDKLEDVVPFAREHNVGIYWSKQDSQPALLDFLDSMFGETIEPFSEEVLTTIPRE